MATKAKPTVGRRAAEERIAHGLEDAILEVYAKRWTNVEALVRAAADGTRALLATPANVRKMSDGARADLRYSQSLVRGIRILSCFTEERPVWRLADLASHLDESRSTMHRYLVTLVALGQLEQTTGRMYRLARDGDK